MASWGRMASQLLLELAELGLPQVESTQDGLEKVGV